MVSTGRGKMNVHWTSSLFKPTSLMFQSKCYIIKCFNETVFCCFVSKWTSNIIKKSLKKKGGCYPVTVKEMNEPMRKFTKNHTDRDDALIFWDAMERVRVQSMHIALTELAGRSRFLRLRCWFWELWIMKILARKKVLRKHWLWSQFRETQQKAEDILQKWDHWVYIIWESQIFYTVKMHNALQREKMYVREKFRERKTYGEKILQKY